MQDSEELKVQLPTPRAVTVLRQGREVATHIIRMNFILAELYIDEDMLICEYCGSMDLFEYKSIEPEYRDSPTSYFEINYYGTRPAQPNWRDKRDKIEKEVACNFCSHTISLGFEWSDWYKARNFEVATHNNPIIQSDDNTDEEQAFNIWTPNTAYSWVGTHTVNSSSGLAHKTISTGCVTLSTAWKNSNGTRVNFR